MQSYVNDIDLRNSYWLDQNLLKMVKWGGIKDEKKIEKSKKQK